MTRWLIQFGIQNPIRLYVEYFSSTLLNPGGNYSFPTIYQLQNNELIGEVALEKKLKKTTNKE